MLRLGGLVAVGCYLPIRPRRPGSGQTGAVADPALTPVALAGLLAEPARLKVLAAVVLGAEPADLAAARSTTPPCGATSSSPGR